MKVKRSTVYIIELNNVEAVALINRLETVPAGAGRGGLLTLELYEKLKKQLRDTAKGSINYNIKPAGSE